MLFFQSRSYHSAPPTTKYAGHTPHPIALSRRKLDFESPVTFDSPMTIVPKKKPKIVFSKHTRDNCHYFFFDVLPDSWLISFCAKGHPNGEAGFLDGAYEKLISSLQNDDDSNSFASKMMVTSVLPTRDPITLETREFQYFDKKTGQHNQLKFLCFVYHESYLEGNITPERWCRNQIRVLKQTFKTITNLTYGGVASSKGWYTITALDEIFLPDDVAALAYSLYDKAIEDGSFFENRPLLDLYFKHTVDVVSLFKDNHLLK